MSTSRRVGAEALALALAYVLGDYKCEFGLLRDFGPEMFKQNEETTFKIQVSKHAKAGYIFKSLVHVHKEFEKGAFRRLYSMGARMEGEWRDVDMVLWLSQERSRH